MCVDEQLIWVLKFIDDISNRKFAHSADRMVFSGAENRTVSLGPEIVWFLWDQKSYVFGARCFFVNI